MKKKIITTLVGAWGAISLIAACGAGDNLGWSWIIWEAACLLSFRLSCIVFNRLDRKGLID